MEETQSKMWVSGVALIPYLAIAGAWTWYIDGHQRDFLTAAAWLLGGRILYAVLDSIMSTIAWRWYARQRTADKMVKIFQNARMPQREYEDESLSMYLTRLEEDEHPVTIKCAARQLNTLLDQAKADGILQGGRMEQAITDAYNRHTR